MNRTLRNDGKMTRQHILETAAQLFAEKGYGYTTSKEICQQSGANSAAVNYHFGSKEQLYHSVLLEMHDRLISLDTLNHIAHGQLTSQQKLAAVLDELMKSIVERKWHARMFIRELLSPSAALEVLLTKKILPKFQLVMEIISELTGIPAHEPAVIYCLISIIGPNAVLLIANDNLVSKLLPKLANNANQLKQHLTTFSLAGLEAIAKEYNKNAI